MQQQDVKERTSAALRTMMERRKNILKMLERITVLAIKKTVRFPARIHQIFNFKQGSELSPRSGVGSEVVHAQCVVNILPVHRLSRRA